MARCEPRDEVELPQRSGAIEGARDDVRHLLGQLCVAAWRCEPEFADVKVQVEVAVVDPVWVVEAQRYFSQPPAQRRQQC